MVPVLYVVARPNGAGKTTAFKELVPEGVDYINADLIAKTLRSQAKGLNTQELANSEATKLFYEKVSRRESFSIETNLADVETYKSFEGLQALGYKIYISFLSTDLDTCIARVKQRVQLGGHNVNPDVIRARYETGLKLLAHYKSMADRLALFDTSNLLTLQIVLQNGMIIEKIGDPKQWMIPVFHHSALLAEQRPMTQDQARELYSKKKKKDINKG